MTKNKNEKVIYWSLIVAPSRVHYKGGSRSNKGREFIAVIYL